MQSPPTKLGENQKTNKQKIFHWLVNAFSTPFQCLKNNVQGPKPGTQEPAQQVSTPLNRSHGQLGKEAGIYCLSLT